MNREAVYLALFNALSGLPAFVTKSRKLKHWQDVPRENQPALFVNQTGETAVTTTGLQSKWLMRVDVYVYGYVAPDAVAGSVLNPLIDAVCNALNTPHPVTGRVNLGVQGVEWVRVEGNIETDEGALGEQAVAIIPVVILST